MRQINLNYVLTVVLITIITTANAQNSKIKCYFNHSVNKALSTGTTAVYLPKTFPDTIVAYINRAKYTLDFAIYDFTSTGNDDVAQIATAVNAAYKRGLVVRWINNGSSSNTGMKLLNDSIPRISSPTTSGYGIMHNKFLVIDVNSPNTDDAFVITGSCNYSQEQSDTDYNNLLIVQDPKVAGAYYDQFNQMWGGAGRQPNLTTSAFGTHKVTSTQHYFNVAGTPVYVHFSPKDTCGNYLKDVASSANHDLTAGIYTFTDNSIANIILNKFDSGLSVRVIMDQYSKTYSPYTTLAPLGKNLAVYVGTDLYHNKIMVADALDPSSDPQVATGSFNWTSAAENLNDENLIVVHDATLANEYYQSLCKNITDNGGNGCTLPLPVDWVSFTGIAGAGNKATLSWETSKEVNNNYFEVERSADGDRFETLGTIKANKTDKYQFVDANTNTGQNFYRIKQVDDNGAFSYSKTISVYIRTIGSVGIYPNPATTQLYVSLPLGAVGIVIYDVLGKQVKYSNVNGLSTTNIDVSTLAKGNYYIEITSNTTTITKQFLKQ